MLTTLHAGGKFGDVGATRSPAVSTASALGRQRPLPAAPARDRRDGHFRARTTSAASRRATSTKARRPTRHGTKITFPPDLEIFEEIDFDLESLVERLRETAFLTRGLKIELVDERGETNSVTFKYNGGIEDFVRHPQRATRTRCTRRSSTSTEAKEEGQVEIAMQWNTSYQESIFSFANNINTHEGGSHLSGFRSALTRTLNAYARDESCTERKKDDNLAGEDIREGFSAVI